MDAGSENIEIDYRQRNSSIDAGSDNIAIEVPNMY